jgi:hypothetical protein
MTVITTILFCFKTYLYLGAALPSASCLVTYTSGPGVHVGIILIGSDLGPFPMSAAGDPNRYAAGLSPSFMLALIPVDAAIV